MTFDDFQNCLEEYILKVVLLSATKLISAYNTFDKKTLIHRLNKYNV